MRRVYLFPWFSRHISQSVRLGVLTMCLGVSPLAMAQQAESLYGTTAPALPQVSTLRVEHISAEEGVKLLAQLFGTEQVTFVASNNGHAIFLRITENDDQRRDQLLGHISKIMAEIDQPKKVTDNPTNPLIGQGGGADDARIAEESKFIHDQMEAIQRKLQATINEQQARIDALQQELMAKQDALQARLKTTAKAKEHADRIVHKKIEAQRQVQQAIDQAMKVLAKQTQQGDADDHAKALKGELKALHKSRTDSQRNRLRRLRDELDALERELEAREKMSDDELDQEIKRQVEKRLSLLTPPAPSKAPAVPTIPGVPPIALSTPPVPPIKPVDAAPAPHPVPTPQLTPQLTPPTSQQPNATPAPGATPGLPALSSDVVPADVQALVQQAERQPSDVGLLNKSFEVQTRIIDAHAKGLESQLNVARVKRDRIQQTKDAGQATEVDVATAESELVQLEAQLAVVQATRELLTATHEKNLENALKLAHSGEFDAATNLDVATDVQVEIEDNIEEEAKQAAEEAAEEAREAAEEAAEEAREAAEEAEAEARKAAEEAREAAEQAEREAAEERNDDADHDDDKDSDSDDDKNEDKDEDEDEDEDKTDDDDSESDSDDEHEKHDEE